MFTARAFPLLLLIGFAAEITSIILMGKAVGVLVTLLLLFLGMVAGVAVFRSTGARVADALRNPLHAPGAGKKLAGATMLRTMAGLLLMIPGFASDIAAGILLLPPVQSWIISRLKIVEVNTGATSQNASRGGVVIDGEVIDIDEPLPPARQIDHQS